MINLEEEPRAPWLNKEDIVRKNIVITKTMVAFNSSNMT